MSLTIGGPDLRPYDKDNGHAGIIAPTNTAWGVPSAAGTLAANRTYGSRFVPSRNMTIASMHFQVATAAGTGDSNIDLAIYDGTGQSKLASSGASALGINTSTTLKGASLTSPLSLTAGTTYYAALSTASAFAGTAPAILAILAAGSSGTSAQWAGTSLGLISCFAHTAGGTAPSAIVVSSSALAPVIFMREV